MNDKLKRIIENNVKEAIDKFNEAKQLDINNQNARRKTGKDKFTYSIQIQDLAHLLLVSKETDTIK